MLKEEYEWLKKKHLANGYDSREAHTMITKFKEGLEKIKYNMKSLKKSKAEIKQKEQQLFQEEFQKLCMD